MTATLTRANSAAASPARSTRPSAERNSTTIFRPSILNSARSTMFAQCRLSPRLRTYCCVAANRRSGPRPCENSTRYNRTRNFEACGHAQSKKIGQKRTSNATTSQGKRARQRGGNISRRHVFTALALRRPFVCCLAHSEDGDDLSELTVRLQIAVSFDDLVEGKGAIDNGLQLSFVEASANVSDRRL